MVDVPKRPGDQGAFQQPLAADLHRPALWHNTVAVAAAGGAHELQLEGGRRSRRSHVIGVGGVSDECQKRVR